VAETGPILLTGGDVGVTTIAVLAQHLVVLLDPADLVDKIRTAYSHPGFRESDCAVLLSGPSGSADIAGDTVHPTQGVTTLTAIFCPRAAGIEPSTKKRS
jgi:L-lactate dehydrogenase complex protein LldG